SARGDRIISAGDDGSVKIWSAADSREMKSIAAHDGPVTGLTVSSDGAKIISAGADRAVKVWVLAALKPDAKDTPAATIALPGPAQGVALSPDGTRIAAAFSGAKASDIRIFDAANGKELQGLDGHAGPVHALAFLGDSRTVV